MKSKILVLLVLVFALGIGCAKKKKPEESLGDAGANGAAQTAEDTNIQNKDLSFNAQGSDSGEINGLYTIHFEYDKSAITGEARSQIQKNVAWMKEHADVKIQVEGHCDRHGSIEYNLALGERRAKAVRAYMINLGIPGKRLSTISYGKEKPLDSAETDEADGKNRRANFVVQK